MSNNGVHTGLLVPPSPRPPNSSFPGDIPRIYDHISPSLIICDHINYNYDIPIATICTVYIIFGIVYSFCGYRCFKLIMFLTGFIFGSIIVYLICLQEQLLPSYGNAGVALLAGFLFGLITMLIQYVGLFMTGLHTGLLTGLGGLIIADHVLLNPPNSVWICIGVLLGSGLLFATLNLHWMKGLTIFGTAVYGGAIIATSTDYFVERWSMISWIWDRATLRDPVPPPCWFSWIVLGLWPAIIIVGLITQCAITGRGIYHTESLRSRKKSRGTVQRARTREERAELRQKKYRYLYQVRTAHGDVISQSYVKSLQKKNELGGPGECSTLQSDATHVTILPDSQLAALTESEDDSQIDIRTHR